MNSFRFIERGIRAEIARQEKILDGGRDGRAGDAALRPRLRRDHLAALQGGGARLPLLPRARPAAGRDRARQMLDAARADMTELPADRAERLERELGAERRERAAAGLPRRARRLLRGRARPPRADPAPGRRRSPTGSPASCVARLDDGRGSRRARASRPSALAALVGLVGAPSRSASAPRARCSTGSSPRAASRRRSSRPRASPRSAATTSWRRSSPRRSRPTPTPPQRVRDGNAKAIGPIVGHVMRETKGRADGTEVSRLIHEQLGVMTQAPTRSADILDFGPMASRARRRQYAGHEPFSSQLKRLTSSAVHPAARGDGGCGRTTGRRIRRYRSPGRAGCGSSARRHERCRCLRRQGSPARHRADGVVGRLGRM